MTALLRDLGHWAWRLAPANPILVRVVFAGGRRFRHVVIRGAYLLILILLVVFGVVYTLPSSAAAATSLADLAKSATTIFKSVAVAQLVMVCMLAPIFTASAITQEKDSNTFNILLTTPLSNAQIVFGTLLSRLYFVFALILGAMPLFCLLMVYGGVTLSEIGLSCGLAATSALACGALAIFMSIVRAGTRKTIFSFYVALFTYLVILYAIKDFSSLLPPEAQPAPGETARMSWLAAFHPLLALFVALNETPAPSIAAVAHYGTPWSWLLAYPAACYMVMTSVTAIVLCLASLSFVRAATKEGEPTLFNKFFGRWFARKGPEDERSRAARHVWERSKLWGPVAWREAATRASGGGRGAQRVIVVLCGVAAAGVLVYLYATGLPSAQTRQWLSFMICFELGLALLVAANTAATALTREKETGTLDILLLSPLVSREILLGKLWGLVVFAIPMLAIPFLSLLLFVLYDLAKGRYGSASSSAAIVNPETLLTLPLLLATYGTLACMIGMWFSITQRKTVQAVVWSMTVVMIVCGITWCGGMMFASQSATVTAAFMPMSPISAALIMIDPQQHLEVGNPSQASLISAARSVGAAAALVWAVIDIMVGYYMYKNMIRNFDMVIRKQTT